MALAKNSGVSGCVPKNGLPVIGVYQIQAFGSEVFEPCEKPASPEIRNSGNGLRMGFFEKGFPELRVLAMFSVRRSWMSAAPTNTKASVLEHGFP